MAEEQAAAQGEQPQQQFALQRIYTQDDNIMLVIKPKSGDVFTAERLSAIREITESAWKVPFATRVDSITNFQHSYAEGDDLTVRDLVEKKADLSPGLLAEIKAVALREPFLVDRVISPDGTTTGININPCIAIFQKPVPQDEIFQVKKVPDNSVQRRDQGICPHVPCRSNYSRHLNIIIQI